MPSMRKPNFIIGGTSAGGTSFLSAMLVQHPQIYLPKEMRPEPHYFYKSWEYSKGDEYYLQRWFSQVPDSAIAVGERSSSYLFGAADVARRVAAFNPAMKFIFTLRNPIERTWANYRFTVLQGLEEYDFETALENEAARIKAQEGIWAEIQPHNYTGRGFYGQEIRAYLEFFPSNQLLFMKSEQLSRETDQHLQRIYDFLALDDRDFIPARAVDFTAVTVINPALQKELRSYFADRFDKVIEACRKNEPIDVFIENAEDKIQIERLKTNMTEAKQPMPIKARQYLQSVFADDMRLLQDYVDFDIADWR